MRTRRAVMPDEAAGVSGSGAREHTKGGYMAKVGWGGEKRWKDSGCHKDIDAMQPCNS